MNGQTTFRLPRRLTALVLAVLLALPTVYATAGEEKLQTTRTLTDGLDYINTITNHATAGRVESFALELSPDSAAKPILLQASGTIYGAGTINLAVSYAKNLGYHVLGAINTDYFSPSTGVPIGIVIEDGVYKSSAEESPAMTVSDGAIGLLENPQVTITLTNGRDGAQTVLTHLNKMRAGSGGLYLYNKNFSTVSTRTSSPGWMVRMQMSDPTALLSVSGSLELVVTELLRTDSAVSIGENEYILTADDASGLGEVFERFQVGDTISLQTDCGDTGLEAVEWAGGTGDVMVRDGALTDTANWIHIKEGRAPRTALGVKPDGTAVLYAVDGRQSGYSGGLSQKDLAQELLNQGCDWVVNLDGGGSTAMSVWVPGQTGPAVVSSPSDGKPRGCATYLLLVSDDAGDGAPSRLALKEDGLVVLAGSSVDLGSVAVLDSSLNVLSQDPGPITVESERGLGTLEGAVYTAGSETGTDKLTLYSEALDIEGAAQIHVVDTLTWLNITKEGSGTTLTALNLSANDQVQLTAQGTYWSKTALRSPTSVTWTVDGGVGTITPEGLFTATGAGGSTGTITASAGGQTQTISVSLENLHVDVPDTHWAYTAVDYCYRSGLVGGISANQYGPDLRIRRGDFLLMLYGSAGKPNVSSEVTFSDVSPSDYYYSAIAWAQANQLASGMGDGRFGPNTEVTREQAFTILNQALPILGITCDPAPLTTLEQFHDQASISSWAAQHAATLVAQLIIGGDTAGNLNPKSSLSRAEMAVLLYKLAHYQPPVEPVTPPTDPTTPTEDPVAPVDPNTPAEDPVPPADPTTPTDPTAPEPPAEPDGTDVTGIALNKSDITLSAGDSYRLIANLSPEGAASPVTWTSSAATVAPVSENGTVTNLNTSGGQANVTITATVNGVSASCIVRCPTAKSAGSVRGAQAGLNVRSGPSTASSTVDSLREGSRVVVLEVLSDGWIHVAYPSKGAAATGYVSGAYIVLD